MKLVLNKCYGGFGLSDLAYRRLIELGVKVYDDINDLPEARESEELWILDDKRHRNYYSNVDDSQFRSHPLLIQVVEELGEEDASGQLSMLKIVEIEDGVDFEIYNYDGVETAEFRIIYG